MSETKTTGVPGNELRFGPKRPKVPPFARFRDTSAWRKDKRRVREYKLFQMAQKLAEAARG